MRGGSPMRAKLRMSPPSAIVIASGSQHLVQRGEDAVRDACGRPCRRGALGQRLGVLRRAPHVLVAQRLRPRGVELRRRLGDRVAPARRAPARVSAKQLDLAAAVLAQFLPVVGDADEARVRQHRRRAVARLVVELAADDDHAGRPPASRARAPRRPPTDARPGTRSRLSCVSR